MTKKTRKLPVRVRRTHYARYDKKNPNDATFRNINALKKRVAKIEARLTALEQPSASREGETNADS